MSLVSQAEFARRKGFSRQYVNKLVKQDKLKLVGNKIDDGYAEYTLSRTTDPVGQAMKESYSSIDSSDSLATQFLKSKIKNEVERGKILEIEAQEKSGKLVPVEEVKKTAFAKARIVRDGLLNIPDRVSAMLSTIDDAAEVHCVLTAEIRSVLEELSSDT